MTRLGGGTVPALSVLVLAVLAVLPWGLPADGRFVLPFLPVIAIHYWSSRHPGRLSPLIPFAAGLLVDVLSNGPLGYWPLLYLTSALLAGEVVGAPGPGSAARSGLFVAALMVLVAAAWGVSSLYDFAVADWRPFAWAAWVTALAYPPVAAVLGLLDPEPLRPSNDRLERGV